MLLFICYLAFSFLNNRLPTKVLNNISPYEAFHNTCPDLSFLKVFGSLAYASTLSAHRSKLDPRAQKCIFLGYSPGTKGFLLFDLKTRKLFLIRNVIFFEHIFPFHNVHYTSGSTPTLILMPVTTNSPTYDFSLCPTPTAHPTDPSPIAEPSQPPQHSTRTRKRPTYLQDYHCTLHSALSDSSPSYCNEVSGITHPVSHVLSYDHLSPSQKHFTLTISSIQEPTCSKTRL